jgi:transcriptional regulator with XRE-family HTH domain
MAQVMELIDQERKRVKLSAEKFAHMVGVTTTTYSRQNNGKQGLGLDSLQAYARYARSVNNTTLLEALGAYALEIEPDQIKIKPKKSN